VTHVSKPPTTDQRHPVAADASIGFSTFNRRVKEVLRRRKRR
jgi:hypothetical protein